jgi:hypothetical protein
MWIGDWFVSFFVIASPQGSDDGLERVMKKIVVTALCAATLGTLGVPPALAQVVNGNFGTGDFTGWTTSPAGDPYYTSVTNSAPAPGATYAANIGAYYDDSIPANLIQGYVKQTITTTPGYQYTLSFLYGEQNVNPSFGGNGSTCCYLDPGNITTSNDPSSNIWAQNNNLNVLWNGVSVDSASNFFTSDPANYNATTNPDDGISIGDYFYDKASVVVTAIGTSTVLEFDADDYQQGVILTDISLTSIGQVPEPGTLAVLASGFAGLAFLVRRRRQSSAF